VSRETPRQAKVRRMAERFAEDRLPPGMTPAHEASLVLAAFGLEVWEAAYRQFKREASPNFRRRLSVLANIRKAGH
jgi:hypothetical protein